VGTRLKDDGLHDSGGVDVSDGVAELDFRRGVEETDGLEVIGSEKAVSPVPTATVGVEAESFWASLPSGWLDQPFLHFPRTAVKLDDGTGSLTIAVAHHGNDKFFVAYEN
jgi:hypothetical protein